jgi:hypothetical protein
MVKSLMEKSAADSACLKVKRNSEVSVSKMETVEDMRSDLTETFDQRVQG